MQKVPGTESEIGFGGSCHWCTEAIFLSLKGVKSVRQGWISGHGEARSFSEAVIVRFDAAVISLDTLIEIHLRTHSSTADHSMRSKYRSAVYVSSAQQEEICRGIISRLQDSFEQPLVIKVILLRDFRENNEKYLNYYYSNPEKPFCRTYIEPKLRLLMEEFSTAVNPGKTPALELKGNGKIGELVFPRIYTESWGFPSGSVADID